MSLTIVVVPCYNEAARLDLQAFRAFVVDRTDVRFLFVNDGSRDNTLQIVRGLEQENPQAFIVHSLKRNSGKAEAVRIGVMEGLKLKPDHIAYWDADLATPLESITPFVEILESRPEIQLVIGSRVNLLGRRIERRPMRHYLGRIAATLASLTLGLSVYDTQCGAKMFRANAETAELFGSSFQTHWIFDIELLARMIAYRRNRQLPSVENAVYELPLTAWHDVRGSNIRMSDFLKSFFELRIVRKVRKGWERGRLDR